MRPRGCGERFSMRSSVTPSRIKLHTEFPFQSQLQKKGSTQRCTQWLCPTHNTQWPLANNSHRLCPTTAVHPPLSSQLPICASSCPDCIAWALSTAQTRALCRIGHPAGWAWRPWPLATACKVNVRNSYPHSWSRELSYKRKCSILLFNRAVYPNALLSPSCPRPARF